MRVSQRTLYYGLPLVIIIVLYVVWRGSSMQSGQFLTGAKQAFPSI